MLESNARQPALESGASSASTKRNPFELLASIFVKKKSLVQESDVDLNSEEYGQSNDENLFPLEPDDTEIGLGATGYHCPAVVKRNRSTERDTHSLKSDTTSLSPATSSKRSSVKDDLEALHLSRQDNPYLQHLEKLSTQEDRPPSLHLPASPFKDPFLKDNNQENVDIHQHLIRSPPPQFPQNVTHFIYSRANSPRHQNKESSSSSPEISEQSLKNGKKAKFLKPIQTKGDLNVLDPGIRKVLEYQKNQMSGFQQPTSQQVNQSSNTEHFVPVTPTCLREIPYNPPSRWVHAKGSRPTIKCSTPVPNSSSPLVAMKDPYQDLFDDPTCRKTPLGPINVGRTYS